MKAIALDRSLDLRRNTIIELTQMMVGLVVAIGMGWLTRSVWSFVASGLAGSLVNVLLSRYWLPGRKDRFEWKREAVVELVRFGRWVLLSSAIGMMAMNGDRLMLAGWTTPMVLGYYSIASQFWRLLSDGTAARIFSGVCFACT